MVKSINTDELKKNRKNYVLIDVREQEELLGGNIDDSIHLPLGQLIRKVRKTEKDEFSPEERHRLFLILTKQVDVVKSELKVDIVNLEGGFAAWENKNGNGVTKTY